jgi:formylglycine-generating enzyme required for sulfatase activity
VELVPPEPIEIRAEGEGGTIRIRATRRWFKDPIPLLFPDLPKGVVVSQGAVIPADSDDIEVQLLADRTARPGTSTVTVRAEAANQPEVTFPLTIHQGHWEPNWEVVPGAEPVQDATGKWYYRQIDVRRGGQRVRFLLVEKLATDDPAISCSFYIMRDKVSNGLFQAAVGDPEFEKLLARFAGCHEKAVQRKWPQPPPDGAKDWNNLPMLNATAAEAHAFALWLGGKLPTDSQWWKAAGARHPDWKSPGPFRPVVRPLVAVGIPQAMPMGEDTDDVGPYGCRYMAGNGLEWTRTEHITNADWTERLAGQALPSNIDILLTGREYHFPQPLLFKDRDDRPRETERFSYVPRGDIGFRVVIELR